MDVTRAVSPYQARMSQPPATLSVLPVRSQEPDQPRTRTLGRAMGVGAALGMMLLAGCSNNSPQPPAQQNTSQAASTPPAPTPPEPAVPRPDPRPTFAATLEATPQLTVAKSPNGQHTVRVAPNSLTIDGSHLQMDGQDPALAADGHVLARVSDSGSFVIVAPENVMVQSPFTLNGSYDSYSVDYHSAGAAINHSGHWIVASSLAIYVDGQLALDSQGEVATPIQDHPPLVKMNEDGSWLVKGDLGEASGKLPPAAPAQAEDADEDDTSRPGFAAQFKKPGCTMISSPNGKHTILVTPASLTVDGVPKEQNGQNLSFDDDGHVVAAVDDGGHYIIIGSKLIDVEVAIEPKGNVEDYAVDPKSAAVAMNRSGHWIMASASGLYVDGQQAVDAEGQALSVTQDAVPTVRITEDGNWSVSGDQGQAHGHVPTAAAAAAKP